MVPHCHAGENVTEANAPHDTLFSRPNSACPRDTPEDFPASKERVLSGDYRNREPETGQDTRQTKGFTMLVLSRKLGEKITIGHGVTVSVVRVHGNRVQLGIEAPPDVRIYRDEVRDRQHATASEPCTSSECCG